MRDIGNYQAHSTRAGSFPDKLVLHALTPLIVPRTLDAAATSRSPAVRAAHRRAAQLPPRGTDRDAGGPVVAGASDTRRLEAVGSRRTTHVIDRALAYRRYADAGMAAVAIARRVRKSKGHVSILLRLGAALEGMEPGEVAALRTPAVTWRLVQRLVRGDSRVQTAGERTAAVLALRRALRDAIAGFSSQTVDRRKQRKGRTPGAPALERFDPGAFAADPTAYVAGHLDALVAAHEAMARHALRMLDRALAAERLAAVPLSALARLSRAQLAAIAERGRAHLSAEQRRAVDALATATRTLQHLSEVAAALRTVDPPDVSDRRPLPRPTSPAAIEGETPDETRPTPAHPFEVMAADLEIDLAD